MNKIILTSILLISAALAACGTYNSGAASNTANASNSNISFGVYDIASSDSSQPQKLENVVETRTV